MRSLELKAEVTLCKLNASFEELETAINVLEGFIVFFSSFIHCPTKLKIPQPH